MKKLETWGKSDQKMLIIQGADFRELYEHLETGEWIIGLISAVTGYEYPYCYIVLERS